MISTRCSTAGRRRLSIGLFISLMILWPIFDARAADTLFEDYFDRPNAREVGNGWQNLPVQRTCDSGDKVSAKIQNQTLFSDTRGGDGQQGPNPTPPGEGQPRAFGLQPPLDGPPVEIEDGMLVMRYQYGQENRVVFRDIDKKVVRLSFDFAPLYAMGGLDDRAWMGVKIFYFDAKGQVLGEIRHVYHNSVYEELANSDTLFSSTSHGPFDGSSRHAVLDVETILKDRLYGVEVDRIATTRILFEIASSLCEATVEGYVDNVVAVLADRAGLLSFTRAEIVDIVRTGAELFDNGRNAFPKNWIDAIHAKHGQQRLVAWLNRIPRQARDNPGELALLMHKLFNLSGKDAYATAFAVSMLLHYL